MNSKSSWAVACDEFPIRSIDYFALVTSVADFDFNFPAQTQQASHVAKTRVLSDQQHTHLIESKNHSISTPTFNPITV